MIKVPTSLSKIREVLSRKKRELEVGLLNLTRDDPFRDKDRLTDKASSDTEAKAEIGHERVEALKQELQDNLNGIKEALGMIKRGTYGTCESCGKKIDKARLDAFPEAIYCIECENKKETA